MKKILTADFADFTDGKVFIRAIRAIRGSIHIGCGSAALPRCAKVPLYQCVLGLLLLASPLAQAQFTWTTNGDNTITITGYTGPGGDVAIPDTITGLPVTGISDQAFFSDDSLTSLMISDSITNIGDYAFVDCNGLTVITVDASNSFYTSVNGVLFDKSQTTLIQYPPAKGATYYMIPNGVTNIVESAFDGCTSLIGVTIPGSVTSIGPFAFNSCINLTSVTIPGSVTSTGDHAFYYCLGLTNITIANGVASIGNSAFANCAALTSVRIPGSVTNIGAFAFDACTNLTSITIPNSVTSIGNYAFGGCGNLRNACFLGDAPAAGGYAFAQFDSNPYDRPVYDPATVFYLPGTAGWGSLLGGVTAVLWNPLIQSGDGSFGVHGNQFGFNITGTADIPIAVEPCTNLANPVWTPLATMTLTNGSVYFSEPLQTNSPARFYRIGSP